MRIAVREGTARDLLPLLFLFIPKCPLCVLPLFAAFPSVLPSAPVLDGLVGVMAAAWLLLLARARPSGPALAAGIGGALVLLASRVVDLPLAGWAGALAMAGTAAVVRAGKLRSGRGACAKTGCP